MDVISKKVDANKIMSFLDDLASQEWIRGSSRYWWPNFVFHFSDIRNIVDILKSGKILSRNALQKDKGIPIDCASPIVIGQTPVDEKSYVRLYFRPRTPTQYHMEGIRPKGLLKLGGAHCPVPVFLLLDSKELLSRQNCMFTNGNLGSTRHQKGSSYEFLSNLPFRKIYHVGSFNPDEHEIIFHRNAEVIFPDELDLNALRYIVCRSAAEMDTLIHLLPLEIWQNYKDKILVEGKLDLYELRWNFIERVDLSEELIIFTFSPDTNCKGPFEAQIELIDKSTGKNYSGKWEDFHTEKVWRVKVPQKVTAYSLQLTLDGHITYANEYIEDGIPF
jgi:hypothetical protein